MVRCANFSRLLFGALSLMKAGLQSLFVLFYLTSAFAATQLQTTHSVNKVRLANLRTETPALETCSDEDRALPRYRDAKKAAKDFQGPPVWLIVFTHDAASEGAEGHGVREYLSFAVPPSHPRAPPELV
jgi:hypothetical protein